MDSAHAVLLPIADKDHEDVKRRTRDHAETWTKVLSLRLLPQPEAISVVTTQPPATRLSGGPTLVASNTEGPATTQPTIPQSRVSGKRLDFANFFWNLRRRPNDGERVVPHGQHLPASIQQAATRLHTIADRRIAATDK